MPVRTTQSLGVMPLVVYPSNLFSFLEKFIYFGLFGAAHCFWALPFKIHLSTIPSSKFMDKQQIQLPSGFE